MESIQKDLFIFLLKRLQEEGLLSQSACSEAINLVHSVIDIPELLRYPVCLKKEASAGEYS